MMRTSLLLISTIAFATGSPAELSAMTKYSRWYFREKRTSPTGSVDLHSLPLRTFTIDEVIALRDCSDMELETFERHFDHLSEDYGNTEEELLRPLRLAVRLHFRTPRFVWETALYDYAVWQTTNILSGGVPLTSLPDQKFSVVNVASLVVFSNDIREYPYEDQINGGLRKVFNEATPAGKERLTAVLGGKNVDAARMQTMYMDPLLSIVNSVRASLEPVDAREEAIRKYVDFQTKSIVEGSPNTQMSRRRWTRPQLISLLLLVWDTNADQFYQLTRQIIQSSLEAQAPSPVLRAAFRSGAPTQAEIISYYWKPLKAMAMLFSDMSTPWVPATARDPDFYQRA